MPHLLFEALSVTRLSGTPNSSEAPTTSANPASLLFAEPQVEPETVPARKLFTNVIQRQWTLPGSVLTPNGLDKRLYQSAPSLSSLLEVPPMDAPIAPLISTT